MHISIFLSNKQDNNARKKINNHPSNKHELALDDEDESLETTMSGGPTKKQSIKTDLQTIRNSQHDQGNRRQSSCTGSDNDDKVKKLVEDVSIS